MLKEALILCVQMEYQSQIQVEKSSQVYPLDSVDKKRKGKGGCSEEFINTFLHYSMTILSGCWTEF